MGGRSLVVKRRDGYTVLLKKKNPIRLALFHRMEEDSFLPHFYSKQKMGKEQLLEIFFYLPTKTNSSSN